MTSILAGGPDIFQAAYAIEFVCLVPHQVVWVWAKLLRIKVTAGCLGDTRQGVCAVARAWACEEELD